MAYEGIGGGKYLQQLFGLLAHILVLLLLVLFEHCTLHTN